MRWKTIAIGTLAIALAGPASAMVGLIGAVMMGGMMTGGGMMGGHGQKQSGSGGDHEHGGVPGADGAGANSADPSVKAARQPGPAVEQPSPVSGENPDSPAICAH